MADFTRAVYEGVALANRENFELIGNLGIRINRLLMIGGGAGSLVWPQIVADVCQTPVFLPAMREAACTGAAILAGVGGGLYPSYAEAVARAVTECREILPDDCRRSTYDEIYSHYLLMKNKL
jgi:xylulokinase